MEQLLEEIGWWLVCGMVASLGMALVVVGLAVRHERGQRDVEQERVQADGEEIE